MFLLRLKKIWKEVIYMEILIDLHNHTIASGHAYSTMEEMISRAKKKGVKILGISDHAPALEGGPNIFYFGNLFVVPREIDGLILLKGVEANILDFEGNIDVPERFLKRLDYAIASLHPLHRSRYKRGKY